MRQFNNAFYVIYAVHHASGVMHDVDVSRGLPEGFGQHPLAGTLSQALSCNQSQLTMPVLCARFTMVAVVPMFDPPRIDTKETIERCIEKGIMVKMVTGDQLLIGKETAKQLGMGQNFYTTEELMEARPPGEAAALTRHLGGIGHWSNI